MSWTFSVPPTPRADFDAAVDAAEASGQDLSLPGVADAVAAGRAALKALAPQVKRALVSGSANGHCLQEDDGPTWYDGLSVSVTGSELPPAAEEA
jgi:hypothetical protein